MTEDGKTERRAVRVADVSPAEINRELTLLRRMFTLAVQDGRLLHKPHVPMLAEKNTRAGFFSDEQIGPSWRTCRPSCGPSSSSPTSRAHAEVLPLEWRHVDFQAGEIRLFAHETKNDEARTFPMTRELRRLLEAQHAEHKRLKKAGHVVPWVFWRMVAHKTRAMLDRYNIVSPGDLTEAARKIDSPALVQRAP